MTDKFTIEPPSIQLLFQRLIDSTGYHDVECIPVADVFKMFEAFFEYEHKQNEHLSKMVNDYLAITLNPVTSIKK